MKALLIVVTACIALVAGPQATFGAAVKIPGMLPDPKVLQDLDREVYSLLSGRKFKELDARVTGILKQYEADPLTERFVDVAFDAFARISPEMEPLLNEWVKRQPRSYAAYVARGVYFMRVGWTLRGSELARQTTKQQFADMSRYFDKAFKDFDRALALNDRLVHPLCYKMDMLRSYSRQDEIRALHDRALKLNPLSWTARWNYLSSLLPQWGGTPEQMYREIEAARPYYGKNFSLRTLEGRVLAESAAESARNRDYEQATRFYSLALDHGKESMSLTQRAHIYAYQGVREWALSDVTDALGVRPNNSQAYFIRGTLYFDTGKVQEALADLTEAVSRDQFYARAWNVRGLALLKAGKRSAGISDLQKAVALNPKEPKFREDLAAAKGAAAGKKGAAK